MWHIAHNHHGNMNSNANTQQYIIKWACADNLHNYSIAMPPSIMGGESLRPFRSSLFVVVSIASIIFYTTCCLCGAFNVGKCDICDA